MRSGLFAVYFGGLLACAVFCPHAAHAEGATPLAIWPFDSYSAGPGRSADESKLLEELLPELAAGELGGNVRFRVVDRRQLSEVLKEQKLGASQLAEESGRLRLGRLVGASWMLFGSFMKVGPMWQIDLRIVDTASSRIVAAGSATGSGEDYPGAVRSAVSHLVRGLP